MGSRTLCKTADGKHSLFKNYHILFLFTFYKAAQLYWRPQLDQPNVGLQGKTYRDGSTDIQDVQPISAHRLKAGEQLAPSN